MKIVPFLTIVFLLSCSKEQVLKKNLAGEWTLISYHEFIFDSTKKNFHVESGSASFSKILKNESHLDLILNIETQNEQDTLNISMHEKAQFESPNIIRTESTKQLIEVVHHTSNDLQLEAVFNDNRLSVMVFKKL
jgi:hypothetical protein